MDDLQQFIEESEPLRLLEPVPLTQQPAAVYLASLGKTSQVTMRQALNYIAALLTNGSCDALTLDWSKLRYHHTAAVRSALLARLAPATAAKMLCALRRTLQEAWRLGLMSHEDYARAADLPRIDVPKKNLKGRAIASDELAAMLHECEKSDTPLNLRDAALIVILRGTGIRREELVNLQLKHYHPDTGIIEVIAGKRDKDRIVYLAGKLVPVVESWLQVRGREPGPLLCPVNRFGRVQFKPLTPDTVYKVVRKLAANAQIEHCSPHDFRRTFCTDLLAADVDPFTVQQLAGHSSPSTTTRYDRRGEETKRAAVQKLEF